MGLIFIFFDEISNFTFSNMTSYGIFLGIIATYFASLGNLVSAHTSKINLPVVPVTGYGMLYGSISLLIFLLIVSINLLYKSDFIAYLIKTFGKS